MSLPTKQDLIDWLLNNPDEVRNVVKGKLQYEPARTRDTFLFTFNGGMYFDGQLYRLCGNLHHTGVFGSVWLNGVENVSVNQHENPAADIIGNHLRELSNDAFNTDFPVEGENPSELAVAAEVEIVDSVACSAASNTKKQFYLQEQELSNDPPWQVVVVALEIDAPEVGSAASNTTKRFQPFRPQPLRGARLSPLATEIAGATSTRPSRVAHAFGVRPGHLVIVGSGIKSLAQLTMEAVGHIKAADEVFYAVADPLTEAFIEKNAKKAYDMYILYDDGKPRLQTYVQMAEVMLRALRQGKYVVGVFYGHPGVFVNPSHRAIAIAKEEGFRAEMLAGISAEDNLFADIGIDPSRHGCQTLEATDLLLRKRILLTDSHVVILQVGAVGDLGFNFSGFKNQHFQVLIDRLIKEYGPQHDVYLYAAPSIAIANPLVEKYKIADFRKPEVVKRVTGISTFYLPPKTIRESDPAVGKLLGLKVLGNVGYADPYTPGKPYGERELAAVSGLDGHTIPENYKCTRTTSSMFDALAQLSLHPEMKEKWLRNPRDFLQRFQGLSAQEHAAIISSQPGRVRAAMKKTPQQVATEFVQFEIRNPKIASDYANVCKQNQQNPDGETVIEQWLAQQGYPTKPDDIYAAYQVEVNTSLDFYQSLYHTWLDNVDGPKLLIHNGNVYFHGVKIKKWNFSHRVLSWSSADNNTSSASLTFQILTDDDGQPLPPNSYIGPQFYGSYWLSGQTKPGRPNIFGKVGGGSATNPVKGEPASTWFAGYTVYQRGTTGDFQRDGSLVFEDSDDQPTVSWNGSVIKKLTYADNTLSWSASDGNNTSASLYFYKNSLPTADDPTLGNQFFGKVWNAGDYPPDSGNIFGQIGAASSPDEAAEYGKIQLTWQMAGVNLAFGIVSIIVGNAVMKAIRALVHYLATQLPSDKKAAKEANDRATQEGNNEDAIQERVAESNTTAVSVL